VTVANNYADELNLNPLTNKADRENSCISVVSRGRIRISVRWTGALACTGTGWLLSECQRWYRWAKLRCGEVIIKRKDVSGISTPMYRW